MQSTDKHTLDFSMQWLVKTNSLFHSEIAALQAKDDLQLGMLVSSNADEMPATLHITNMKQGASHTDAITIPVTKNMTNGLTRVKIALLQTKEDGGIPKAVPLCTDILLTAQHVHTAQSEGIQFVVGDGIMLTIKPSENVTPIKPTANTIAAAVCTPLHEQYNTHIEKLATQSQDMLQKTLQTKNLPPAEWPVSSNLCMPAAEPFLWTTSALSSLLRAANDQERNQKMYMHSATQLASTITQTCALQSLRTGRALSKAQVHRVYKLFGQPGALSHYESDHAVKTQVLAAKNQAGQTKLLLSPLVTDDGENWRMGTTSCMQTAVRKMFAPDAKQSIQSKLDIDAHNKFSTEFACLSETQKWRVLHPHTDAVLDAQLLTADQTRDDCEDVSMKGMFTNSHLERAFTKVFADRTTWHGIDIQTQKSLERDLMHVMHTESKPLHLCIVYANAASASSKNADSAAHTASNPYLNTSVRNYHESVFNDAKQTCTGHACCAAIDWNAKITVQHNEYEAEVCFGKIGSNGMKEFTAPVHTDFACEDQVSLNLKVLKDGKQTQEVTKVTSAVQAASITVTSVAQTMQNMSIKPSINIAKQIDSSFVRILMACGSNVGDHADSGIFLTASDAMVSECKALCNRKKTLSGEDWQALCARYSQEIGYGALPETKPGTHLLKVSIKAPADLQTVMTKLFLKNIPNIPQQLYQAPARTSGMPCVVQCSEDDKTSGVKTVQTRNWQPLDLHDTDHDKIKLGAWNNLLLQLQVFKAQAGDAQDIFDVVPTSYLDFMVKACSPSTLHLFETAGRQAKGELRNKTAAQHGLLLTMQQILNLETFDAQTAFLQTDLRAQELLNIKQHCNYLCEDGRAVQTNIFTTQRLQSKNNVN